jgi:hypothetical protein
MSVRNGMPAAELPEVTWRKSRRSGPQGGNCVEIAHLPDGQVAIRNSRHPAGPALVFTPAEWAAFVGGARDGDFDQGPATGSRATGAGPVPSPASRTAKSGRFGRMGA